MEETKQSDTTTYGAVSVLSGGGAKTASAMPLEVDQAQEDLSTNRSRVTAEAGASQYNESIADSPPGKVDEQPAKSSPLTIKEFETMETKHIDEVKFNEKEKKYLSRYLLYLDMKKHVREDNSKPAAKEVKRVMDKMNAKLTTDAKFGGGVMERCGSFHENTKVGDPNEFDYMYKLKIERYTARRVELTQTRAARSDLRDKAYYNLYKGTVSQGTPVKTLEKQQILAKDEHEAFRKVVEKNLRTIPWLNLGDEAILVKTSGPAVMFVLSMNGSEAKEDKVKIDLTLAIEVAGEEETVFDETEGLQLRSWVKDLYDKHLLKCHFVAAHDYWKLSFTTIEKSIMKQISGVEYKGTCYRAIKIMRDSVDVKDTLGNGILSSYPLKVTHLKRTLHTYPQSQGDVEKKWTKELVGENVIEMVRAVGGAGERHQLTGVFLRDNNIMGESDRSYLEGRRILKKLKSVCKSYREHGIINTMIWSCLVVCSVITLAVSYTVVDTDWASFEKACIDFTPLNLAREHNISVLSTTTKPPNQYPPFPISVLVLVVFSIFVWISLVISSIGVIYVYCFNFIRKRSVFMVLPNLKVIYVIVATTSLTLVVIDVFLVVDYIIDDGCTRFGSSSHHSCRSIASC